MPALVRGADGLDQVTSQNFDQALNQLIAASRRSTKPKHTEFSHILTPLVEYAHHHGLQNDALVPIVGLVTDPLCLDQTTATILINALYPATAVPSDLVYLVVSSLGHGKLKASLATQNLLLNWLIKVIEVLDDYAGLRRTYSVLFNLLDTISIRSNLCHLLSKITCKKDVKQYRVRSLLELARNTGDDPALAGLLRCYENWSPDIARHPTAAGKPMKFSHPDPEWRARLRAIQALTSHSHLGHQADAESSKFARGQLKRKRTSIIPNVASNGSERVRRTRSIVSSVITLEDMTGVEDFIEHIDKLELSNQMVAALDDTLLQKYIVLKSDDGSLRRIEDWLTNSLDGHMQDFSQSSSMNRHLVEVFERLASFVDSTKILPQAVVRFFESFLKKWDGIENRELILSLLAQVPLQPFDDLYASILVPLEESMIDNTAETTAVLLGFYTDLVSHWTTQLLTLSPSGPTYQAASKPFPQLINHVSLLSLRLLTSLPTHSHVSTILSYHERLANTISHAPTFPQVEILTPLSKTIYLLIFSNPSLSTLSRLCSILSTYKRTFEIAMTRPSAMHPPIREYARDFVNRFNGFLMDICNLLWRNRAFNVSDQNALGCLMSQEAVIPELQSHSASFQPPQTLQQLFSLSINPVTCALAIVVFRELEDKAEATDERSIRLRHGGPVSQRSLMTLAADGGLEIGWADYRLEVLNWLGQRGVDGLGELMFCTMKHLMGQRKSS